MDRGPKAALIQSLNGALTNNYYLPREQGMLDNVLADMRRGNISHCVVKANGGVAVWRRARKGGQL